MVIYFTGNFRGVLEYIKETFCMLPVSIIKKKYFCGLSSSVYVVYMILPILCQCQDSNLICKLNKVIRRK